MIGNRYQIIETLGEGGMGAVYKGTDTQTEAPVAIKLLKPQVVEFDSDMLERFQREGEALRELNHPSIVKMLDMIEDEGKHYLVMEYVSGGDLSHLLKQGQMSVDRLLPIALDLADALTRAHRLNIVHRDLKPANVLLAEDGTPRLTDFGVAHIGNQKRVTKTGMAIGTMDYLSPEALNGAEVDNRADIWSFGVMLFEMLTGQLPFEGKNMLETLRAIATRAVPDLEELRPDAPIELVDLIYRMLEKDADLRIRSVRLIGAELEAIMQGDSSKSFEMDYRFELDTTEQPKHNLPVQLTPFIGRQHELTELTRLLDDSSTRLITILASGGMGKSRLALELAERLLKTSTANLSSSQLSKFAHGIYFVELAPLTESSAIASAIAETIGYQFHSRSEPKQQLAEHLQDKHMLLIMDNFEHLLDGVGIITDIMKSAQNVYVLATSRERLKLEGETLLRLEGMDFPDWKTPEEAMNYSATRLFSQSAQRTQPGFELQPDDLPHVASICRQVQGMPLGIVLAAAWVEMLSLSEIVEEIQTSLDFLETDVQNVPERHRSIRAVFNPTWNRMTPTEQDIFMKLSIFRGGFTREAAQKIANAGLRQLTALLSKALLRRNPNTGRYNVHELLRQYAEGHLLESNGDISALRDTHCTYYAEWLHKREHELAYGRQYETALNFAEDIDNIRLAWDWACQHLNVEAISQMYFFMFHGGTILNLDMETYFMLEKAIKDIESFPSDEKREIALGYVLQLHAGFGIRLGQIETAKTSAEQALQLLQKHDLIKKSGPARFMFDPRFSLGIIHVIQGNFDQAERMGQEKLADGESRNDILSTAAAYYILMIANLAQGNYKIAYDYAKKAHDFATEGKNVWFVAYCLDEWGNTARALGNYDEAIELYKRSYDTHKLFDDEQGMGAVLNHLASVTLLQGRLEEAEDYYQQSVTLNRDMGNLGGIAESLAGLGNTMLQQGKYEQAEKQFLEALKTVDTDIVNFVLSILIGLGELWLRTDKKDKGREILCYVYNDPSSRTENKDRIDNIADNLGEDKTNWNRDKMQLDLKTVISELI